MQAISREVLLQRGLPSEFELKKGSPLPAWFTQAVDSASMTRSWWQVYLDNFLSGSVGEQTVGCGSEVLQEQAMYAWTHTGILTAADKQVLASKQVTELGIRIDGVHKLLGVSAERLLKTIWATLHHLVNPVWSKKETQIILGRWIFVLQFRRAAMGVLSKSWQVLECKWPSAGQLATLKAELLSLVCLGPILQTDLSTPFDGEVTCSDASETGGAAACSDTLTWSGRSLVSLRNDLRLRAVDCPILIISCFNGIGGAFRLYDILGISPSGRIAVDISRPGNRVTRTVWPDVMEFHDICHIDRAEVLRWANLFPHIREVHFYAGFPCIHLSSARAFRENLDGEGSNLFWVLLDVLKYVQEIFSPFCSVKFVIENVASMDEDARMQISEQLDVSPIKLDPADCLPFSRPRFAWSSEPLYEMKGIRLEPEREYVRAFVTAEPIETKQWIRPGWHWPGEASAKFPTFMKNIKRLRPPPQPAGLNRTDQATRDRWAHDCFRYPPYQYKSQFLVHSSGQPPRLLDASEREILLGFGPGHTSSCLNASEMKQNFQKYEDLRCTLCGDSFAILSFCVMASALSSELMPRMSPDHMVRRLGLAPGATAHPSVLAPMSRWLSYGGDGQADHSSLELVQHLGEILALQWKDLELSHQCGVVSLYSSKSGMRTGSEEAVSIRDSLVLEVLATCQALHCSMSPLITVLLAVIFQKKRFSTKTWLSMPVICVGLAMCSVKELNFNALGAFYATGATVLRAVKSLIQGRLLSPSHKLDSVSLLYYMAPISALWLFFLMLLMEGTEPMMLLLAPWSAEPGAPITGVGTVMYLLVLSGLNACLLNIANFLVTSYTSPVTLQVLGNVKSCLSIGVSVAIFRNSLTFEQAVGVGTCLLGVWLYNQKEPKASAVAAAPRTGAGTWMPFGLLRTGSDPRQKRVRIAAPYLKPKDTTRCEKTSHTTPGHERLSALAQANQHHFGGHRPLQSVRDV
eukprot:s2759_g13.t1